MKMYLFVLGAVGLFGIFVECLAEDCSKSAAGCGKNVTIKLTTSDNDWWLTLIAKEHNHLNQKLPVDSITINTDIWNEKTILVGRTGTGGGNIPAQDGTYDIRTIKLMVNMYFRHMPIFVKSTSCNVNIMSNTTTSCI